MQDSIDLPLASDLSECLDLSRYVRLPDDWWVAVTDVVQSRKAIAEGRYKAVNMAGVAAISAVVNALGRSDLPYVFGGDGAAIAGPPEARQAATHSLAATCRWVDEDLNLELRAAIVSHREIIDAGHHVSAIRVKVSDALSNFAFTGGGVAFAEHSMKAGGVNVPPAPPGARPDLTGLSCRWTPIRPVGREIVSLIVEPKTGKVAAAQVWVGRILDFASRLENEGHPVPQSGPGFSWPPAGLDLEARASRTNEPLGSRKRRLYFETLIAWVLDKTRIPIGPFSPTRYRRYTARNTDDRKYQDGLKITLALTAPQRTELEALLQQGRIEGAIGYGCSIQDSAVLTCFVPSIMSDDHMHFLDGAGGGYAEAASNMRD